MLGGIDRIGASILAPGLVAALVSFWLNTRDERRRAVRDYHSKFLDETREDIRNAVNAGVAYFSCRENTQIRKLQAQVSLYESDIRSSLASIRSACTDKDEDFVSRLSALEVDFLSELTGGEFGTAEAKPDIKRTQRIVGQGSLLRGELARLRRHQLTNGRFGTKLLRPAGFMIMLFVLILLTLLTGVFIGAVGIQ